MLELIQTVCIVIIVVFIVVSKMTIFKRILKRMSVFSKHFMFKLRTLRNKLRRRFAKK